MQKSRTIDKIEATENNILGRSYLSTVLVSLPVFGILFKTLLFWAFLFGENYYELDFIAGFKNGLPTLFVNLSILILIFSCVFLFRSKKERFIYLLVFDAVYTFAAVVYICYLRFFSDVPSIMMLKTIFAKNGSMPSKASDLLLPFVLEDTLFFVDFLAMFLVQIIATFGSRLECRYVFAKDPVERFTVNSEKAVLNRNISFAATAVISLVCVAVVPFSGLAENNSLYANSYGAPTIRQKVAALSPLGVFAGDLGSSIFAGGGKLTATENTAVEDYFAWNKNNYAPNAYTGAATGKNLLFIQLESVENFVIGQTIEGQEITPNLNRLLSKSYYFSNIKDRAGTGNSSDCDMMIQTSTAPSSGVSAFKFYAYNKYNSMPQILKYNGYQTAYYNGVESSFWNYTTMMKEGIKFEGADYDFDRSYRINTYIADESLLSQTLDKMVARGFNASSVPFYAHVTLNNSHAPFIMPEEIKKDGLVLSEKLAKTVVGDYFQAVNYTDRAVGAFLAEAEERGLLDNTIVAIIGDHRGLHKYYPHVVNELPKDVYQDWFSDKDHVGVPLILCDFGMEDGDGVTVDTYGTQLDVMPTLMDLFGIPYEHYADTVMGRSLFSDKLNATVDGFGNLYGEFSTEDEKQLLASFTVADVIYRTDYFKSKEVKFVYE